ncbi:hypothetical protein Micbo1qcDRAFT_178356 [Microdochium bolleyi]|uniref:Rhodopsin domain-containing protein n=1 Tax=Microdochium bolleyi TaxID=196109 RepID=A0A136ITA9_9PEZI|nr:hypothetical protein Micbo1qcDRAFT_178356 [Microdochium bolleyi]
MLLRFCVLRGRTSLKGYDFVLLAAFVVVLVQTALSMHATSLGIGQHRTTISEKRLDLIRQFQYVISLLSIIVLTATKLCVCLFIRAINSFAGIRIANIMLIAVGAANFGSLFVATAFQCPLPSPWLAASTSLCPAAGPIYWYTISTSMAFDVFLCIVASLMVVRVQTNMRTKAIVVGLFASRILSTVFMNYDNDLMVDLASR